MEKYSVYIVIYFKKSYGMLSEKWFKTEKEAIEFQKINGGGICKSKTTKKEYEKLN